MDFFYLRLIFEPDLDLDLKINLPNKPTHIQTRVRYIRIVIAQFYIDFRVGGSKSKLRISSD